MLVNLSFLYPLGSMKKNADLFSFQNIPTVRTAGKMNDLGLVPTVILLVTISAGN